MLNVNEIFRIQAIDHGSPHNPSNSRCTEDDNTEPGSFTKCRACKRRVLRPKARERDGARGGREASDGRDQMHSASNGIRMAAMIQMLRARDAHSGE